MLDRLLSAFLGLAFGDRVLVILSVSIVALLLMVLAFAAASLVLRSLNRRKARRWRRVEAVWEPVILEVLYGSEEPESLWSRVRPEDSLYFVGFLLRYMRRLLGEERDLIRDLARPFLPRVARLVRTGTAEKRARAVQTLALLGLPEYAEVVIAALDDSSPLVAMVAARELCRPEFPHYIELVLERVHRFQRWSRRLLSSMLAAAGQEAAPRLREVLADPDRASAIRAVCAEALYEIRDPEAADPAANALAVAEYSELIIACLQILETVGRSEHLPGVCRMLDHEESPVRAAAVRALGAMGGPDDQKLLLRAMREDPSPWVALYAARGVLAADGREALQELVPLDHPRSQLALETLAR